MSLEEIHMEKCLFTKSYYSLQQAGCANPLCIFWKTTAKSGHSVILTHKTLRKVYTLILLFLLNSVAHDLSPCVDVEGKTADSTKI
jgi:hypothetical protein